MPKSQTSKDAERLAKLVRESHGKFEGVMSGEGAGQQVMSGFADAYRAWLESLSAKPETLMDLQGRYMQEQMRLWMGAMQPTPGDDAAVEAAPDKRFSGAEWDQLPVFKYFRDSYLLTSKMMMQAV